jgi:hypothetical protein
MLHRGRLPVDSDLGSGQRQAINECIRLGLAEPGGDLTEKGLSLRDLILRPEVPLQAHTSATRASAAKYGAAEAKRQKKPRSSKPMKPAAPMVCACGHGPREHLSRGEDVPCSACRSEGKACERYHQAKAPKVEAAA